MTLARVQAGSFQQQEESTLPLRDVVSLTKGVVYTNRLAIGLLSGLGALFIGTPVIYNKLPEPIEGALQIGAMLQFVTAGVVASASKKQEGMWEATAKIQETSFKQSITNSVVLDKVAKDAEGIKATLEYILNQPEIIQPYLLQKYGLINYLQPQQQIATIEASPQQHQKIQSGINPSLISNVEYQAYEPSADWIMNISNQMSESNHEKRRFQHLKVSGGSQAGKSTLFSKLLELLIENLTSKGVEVVINLIDPKYPKTKWAIKPSFVGFDQVLVGVESAVNELNRRKQLCKQAALSNQPQPDFSRYVLIIDEWDSIWGKGKGYPDAGIDKKCAEKVINKVLAILKEGAAYDVTVVVIGQSPLSEATGLSRSDLNSACHIVLGIEALKWVQDPGFPFKAHKDGLEEELQAWLEEEQRVALVVPNLSSPFVEPIPKLTIGQIQQAKTIEPESIPDPWVDGEVDPMQSLKEWYQSANRTDFELIQKFQELTGQQLNTEGVEYLKTLLKQ